MTYRQNLFTKVSEFANFIQTAYLKRVALNPWITGILHTAPEVKPYLLLGRRFVRRTTKDRRAPCPEVRACSAKSVNHAARASSRRPSKHLGIPPLLHMMCNHFIDPYHLLKETWRLEDDVRYDLPW